MQRMKVPFHISGSSQIMAYVENSHIVPKHKHIFVSPCSLRLEVMLEKLCLEF
jgi:hypothetical protein